MRRADLSSLAGGRPTTKAYPDAITYVITAGPDTIRASDGAIPAKLEPLVGVLRSIVALGERR